jgi:predicted phosphodiesterase
MFEIRTVSLVHINRFVFLALALGIARGLLPGPAAANTLAAWVELVGPDMEASIRAIVSTDSTCPELQLGDETVQMQVRAEPGPSVLAEKQAEFPVRVCEAKVPAAERKITLEGVAIPVPAGEFKRIVIVGDTGCRIKKKNTQDCNDPKYWPYPRLANQAADARPDLVIHVGDYLYREKSCQGRTDECPESPVGYGWNIWEVDFFAPSARLLAAAPWIMVRGNHETCKRAGEGWFRFLDHGPFPKKCPKADIGDSFVTGSKGVRFAVMDSAAIAKDEDDLGEEDDVSSGDVENPDAATAEVRENSWET